MFNLNACDIAGLRDADREKLLELLSVYQFHDAKNAKKTKYYEGHVSLGDVNLGLALPKRMNNLHIGCEWGAKCVDVLAARSMFDGFVGTDGRQADIMQEITENNRLISEYMKACKDELKYGCTFATLSADERIGCKIRFHSPQTAAALWNGSKQRIDCGFAIIDTKYDESEQNWVPSIINYYCEDATCTLYREGTRWTAHYQQNPFGRPLMEPMIWNATSSKPLGRSRIKEPIRNLIDGYIRTIANATIALEFATSPQKYILGVTDDQYDAIVNDKFRQYVGSVIAATSNPETGQNPQFGQLQQGNIEPHVQMIRILATQFSAATGLSIADTGIVNDANPTSSAAILAQTQTLVTLAEQLNAGNGVALREIALLAQGIVEKKTVDELDETEKNVIAHFKNPSMPSVAATTDAATKLASVREGFGETDVFLEMCGFDQADIRRIRAQEARARGTAILSEEFTEDENNSDSMGGVQKPAGVGEPQSS